MIPDEQLRYLILGWLRQAVASDAFPVVVREIRENYVRDERGGGQRVDSFTIVTFSGLVFTVECHFAGHEYTQAEGVRPR